MPVDHPTLGEPSRDESRPRRASSPHAHGAATAKAGEANGGVRCERCDGHHDWLVVRELPVDELPVDESEADAVGVEVAVEAALEPEADVVEAVLATDEARRWEETAVTCDWAAITIARDRNRASASAITHRRIARARRRRAATRAAATARGSRRRWRRRVPAPSSGRAEVFEGVMRTSVEASSGMAKASTPLVEAS